MNTDVWFGIVALYEILLLGMLVYLSLKNSTIAQHHPEHMEEGQRGTRMAVFIIIMTLVGIATLTFLQLKQIYQYYTILYWINIMYSTVSPVLYLGVIFIPKVSMVAP